MTGEQFAEWLNNEMEIKGINRRKLAKKSGVGISTVRRCALGIGTPNLETVGLLMDVFGKKLVIVDK